MKLSFHGAAKMVTGSCHLLDTGHHKILFECGIFQGPKEVEALNFEPFPFDPGSIEYVFLSHAHLDHCGRLPKLVKQGFHGKIICTRATRDLTRLILLDAAKLQKEQADDASFDTEAAMEQAKEGKLFGETDVFHTIGLMETYNYGDSVKLSDNLEFRLRDAGHILGSAIIEVWAKNNTGRERKIVFSGDLGHRGQRIVKDPDMVSEADYVIVESTYGNRYHKSRDETVLEFLGIMSAAEETKGNVCIPTFAVERAQEIIYELNLFHRNNLLSNMSVYLDSPMAIEATEIFKKYTDMYDEDAARLIEGGDDPFEFPGFHYSNTTEESKSLNNKTGITILAGSGMATGGRILPHFMHNLPRKNSHVVFVGFQVEGTLGRDIIDGAQEVRIHGKKFNVEATVHTLGGFSAHADQRDIRYWLRGFGTMPQRVFMIHGDSDICDGFAQNIAHELKQDTYVPKMHEEVELI